MDIRKPRRRGLSRREVMKTAAAAGAVASVGPFFHVNPAKAAKTLKILQWSHFVPGYDKWFNNEYVKEWGSKNDTEVDRRQHQPRAHSVARRGRSLRAEGP